MEQLGIHCEHKTPKKDMPILLSSKYSSNILISIPLHCYHPILNLFHLDYCNSFPFPLVLNARRAGIRYCETLGIRERSRKYKF